MKLTLKLQAYRQMLIQAVKNDKVSQREAKQLMNKLIEQEIK